MAGRGDLEGPQARVSVPPAPPIVLASVSPQRRAILEQLHIPFVVVPPEYEERGDDPLELAAGKARSVEGGERPVLGVDTEVVVDGEALGKPSGPAEAEAMLERLSGRTHEVVSGLCLRTRAWEELHRETTRVTFRELTARDLAHYVGSGEWRAARAAMRSRASAARSSSDIEGDYLNVVGLPQPCSSASSSNASRARTASAERAMSGPVPLTWLERARSMPSRRTRDTGFELARDRVQNARIASRDSRILDRPVRPTREAAPAASRPDVDRGRLAQGSEAMYRRTSAKCASDLDQSREESSLEEMPVEAVTPVEALRVVTVQPVHS